MSAPPAYEDLSDVWDSMPKVLPAPSRHRLIVGVDYGTTYSGISFVTTDKETVDDIHVITSWPGQDTSSAWKVPTRMAYAAENRDQDDLQEDQWGYSVRPYMTSCSWTKLLLDKLAQSASHDDPSLRSAIDEGILRLPSGIVNKNAAQVCEDFLRNLYQHMMREVSKRIGENFLNSTPMDCWLTVPAVWSDKAQDLTRAAAKAAGFGSRAGDNIYLISEPEAAAIATLKKHMQPESPNPPAPGDNILICDCGGGTVDITTYSIIETSPALIFEELCVGTGGKCGSTYIDRNLHNLMKARFGESFEQVELRRKGPGSRFMEQWERVKRSFGMTENQFRQELGPIVMEGVKRSVWYDPLDGMVILSPQDVEDLFSPVVDHILELVAEQIQSVENEGQSIDRLVLIGGFGDSAYLFNRVKQWCTSFGIRVVCPKDPQAAIVRGAALRGLEGTVPRKRRARRHYGIAVSLPFRDGIDPEYRGYNDSWARAKLCSNRMSWIIKKGTTISTDEPKSTMLSADWDKDRPATTYMELFSCALDNAPEYCDDPRVERVCRVKVDFKNANRKGFENKRKYGFFGKKTWLIDVELQCIFGSKTGGLHFKSLIAGAVSGTATVEFD